MRYADAAKMEKHVSERERFHMSGYGIRFVLRLRITAYAANLVQNRMGNPEYDVKGKCFPNNLAGFYSERQQSSST